MSRIVLAIGRVWAVCAWGSWIIVPHRGHLSALTSAILLLPAYLLVSIERGRAEGTRAFVALSVLMLLAVGLQVVPGRFDLVWLYLVVPPIVGLLIGLFRWRTGCRRAARPSFPECAKCGYNLTGNESGTCPECGNPCDLQNLISKESRPDKHRQQE